ncbi:MAG TPA: CoA transferase, partial [Acidimicrobiales bacterium]|nr:CoA transferase [Acidimicrobiales bacterium]
RRGIPITPVNTAADLSTDPHLEAVGYWETVDDPALGKLRVAGAPYRFGRAGWSTGPAPALGADTEAVLSALP